MSEAVIEVRMKSGKEFHFFGENAEAVQSKLVSGRAHITVVCGLPTNSEVTIETKYVECVTWYADGRP